MGGAALRQFFSGYRFLLNSEAELQDQMEQVLVDAGVPFERERRLGPRSRPDFFLDGVAVEVKIKGSARAIYRQCERYAGFSEVTEVLLVTNRAMGFPKEINGKPAYFLNLGAAWL